MQEKRIEIQYPMEEMEQKKENINGQTYLGKASLSWENTWEAWKQECVEDKFRFAVILDLELNVSDKTLSRMYQHYNLPSPKSKEGKEYAKSLSLL